MENIAHKQMSEEKHYSLECYPLGREKGGGFLVLCRDLPGCISDGDTREEAFENGMDAIRCWIAANRKWGNKIPPPSKHPVYIKETLLSSSEGTFRLSEGEGSPFANDKEHSQYIDNILKEFSGTANA